MEDMARDIMLLLDTVYPGNPWGVRVYGDQRGGGYFIRHLEFEGKPFGMNTPQAHLFASASELRQDVIMKGGELLERVNLARGKRKEGDEVGRMEGVPERFQPRQEKAPVEFTGIIDAREPIRTEPRPQVKHG